MGDGYGGRAMAWFRRQVTVEPAEVEQLRAELASLREAVDHHGSTTQALHDKLAALDDRVTSVSTELANQLTELGHDIDALTDRPGGLGVDGEACRRGPRGPGQTGQ